MKRTAALVAVLALLGVTVWLVWPSTPDVRGQALRVPVVDGPADDQRVDLDQLVRDPLAPQASLRSARVPASGPFQHGTMGA